MRRYIEFIVRHRWIVLVLVLIATVFLHFRGQSLTVIIDPNNIVPRSHPFVATTLKVEEVFGSRYVSVIGITPKDGDVFNPAVLAKVQSITAKLRETPRVVKANLLSVSARRAKDIRGTEEGMQVSQMMPDVPQTGEQMSALKDALQRNTSYMNSVVSNDFKTITVLAEVRDATPAELKEGKGGFSYVNKKITDIVDAERDDSVDIVVTGYPAFLALLEQYSSRGGILLLIALGVIGVVHYEAFRTLQSAKCFVVHHPDDSKRNQKQYSAARGILFKKCQKCRVTRDHDIHRIITLRVNDICDFLVHVRKATFSFLELSGCRITDFSEHGDGFEVI